MGSIQNVFAAEEKYPDGELTTKDIVQSILNETLRAVVGHSEKVSDSNRIGDCNIAEGLLSQFGYISVTSSDSVPSKIKETSQEKKTQHEERAKEYKVIKEQSLADNELRIQNGKIHLQANGSEKSAIGFSRDLKRETVNTENCLAREVNKTVEGSAHEDTGKKREPSSENILVDEREAEKLREVSKRSENASGPQAEETAHTKRPFTPFTTEEVRQSILQVWKNVNSSVINSLDNQLTNQPQEVVRIMDELSALQVTTNAGVVYPNRARACSLVDDDVRKMVTEIEEINFKPSSERTECADVTSNEGDQGSASFNEKDIHIEGKVGLEVQDTKTGAEEGEREGREEKSAEEPAEEEAAQRQPQGIPLAPGVPSVTAFKSQKFNDSYDFQKNGAVYTMSLTKSDEAFIESSESVIQIIEPQEDSNDENEGGSTVTFSLFHESDLGNYNKDEESVTDDYDKLSGGSRESFRQEEDYSHLPSGMTTVGPVKNLNYNSKILTGPEIDYGKMTMISGSRELKKASTNDSLNSSGSKKSCANDNDDSSVIFFENGYVEFDTVVNHDIASLTKVQKIKEVLSDQPRSEEDLRDEEKLLRPPLDLKDVDAESCDSYNVIDIGMPLLTVEEVNRNYRKDFDQNIQNVLNGNSSQNALVSPGAEGQAERKASEHIAEVEESDERFENVPTSKGKSNEGRVTPSQNPSGASEDRPYHQRKSEEHPQISSSFSCNKSVTQLTNGQNQKHNTISRVLQKASNRFIMKDSDSFLRNSKSLPRDTSKIANTESFKSLLDDCQNSAATMLKKSRSLLRNTQNVLKVVSKTGFGHTVAGDKQQPASEVPVEQMDGRQPTSSKKNEFLKFKDAIKSKVGKTLKNLESITSPDGRTPAAAHSKDLNEVEAKAEQTENYKKLPLRSPLVCANQFLHQSQSSELNKIEGEGSFTTLEGSRPPPHLLDQVTDAMPQNPQMTNDAVLAVPSGTAVADDNGMGRSKSLDQEIEVICGVKFQGNLLYTSPRAHSNPAADDLNETTSDQMDYILMETIHDAHESQIPAVVECSSLDGIVEKPSELDSDASGEITKARANSPSDTFLRNSADFGKSNSRFTLPLDSTTQDEGFEEFIANDGKDLQTSLSNPKLRKNKKLSARIRSFWQTAFGKPKATSQKRDVS